MHFWHHSHSCKRKYSKLQNLSVRLLSGSKRRPPAWLLRLQGLQANLREHWLPDDAQTGLEGRGGTWHRRAGHHPACQQVSDVGNLGWWRGRGLDTDEQGITQPVNKWVMLETWGGGKRGVVVLAQRGRHHPACQQVSDVGNLGWWRGQGLDTGEQGITQPVNKWVLLETWGGGPEGGGGGAWHRGAGITQPVNKWMTLGTWGGGKRGRSLAQRGREREREGITRPVNKWVTLETWGGGKRGRCLAQRSRHCPANKWMMLETWGGGLGTEGQASPSLSTSEWCWKPGVVVLAQRGRHHPACQQVSDVGNLGWWSWHRGAGITQPVNKWMMLETWGGGKRGVVVLAQRGRHHPACQQANDIKNLEWQKKGAGPGCEWRGIWYQAHHQAGHVVQLLPSSSACVKLDWEWHFLLEGWCLVSKGHGTVDFVVSRWWEGRQ